MSAGDESASRINTEGNINDNNISDVGYFEDNLKTDESGLNEPYSSRTLPTPRRFPSIFKFNQARGGEVENDEKFLTDRKLSNVDIESKDFDEKLKGIKLGLNKGEINKVNFDDKEIKYEKKENKLDALFNDTPSYIKLSQSSRKNSSRNEVNYQVEKDNVINEEINREDKNNKIFEKINENEDDKHKHKHVDDNNDLNNNVKEDKLKVEILQEPKLEDEKQVIKVNNILNDDINIKHENDKQKLEEEVINENNVLNDTKHNKQENDKQKLEEEVINENNVLNDTKHNKQENDEHKHQDYNLTNVNHEHRKETDKKHILNQNTENHHNIEKESEHAALDNTNAYSTHSKEHVVLNDHVEVSKEDLIEEEVNDITDNNLTNHNEHENITNKIENKDIQPITNIEPEHETVHIEPKQSNTTTNLDSNKPTSHTLNYIDINPSTSDPPKKLSTPEIIENPFTHVKEEKPLVKPLEASVINNEIISELASKIKISPKNEDKLILEPEEYKVEEIKEKIHEDRAKVVTKTETKVFTATPEIKQENKPETKHKDEIVTVETSKVLVPEPSHITEEVKSPKTNKLDESFSPKVKAKKEAKSLLSQYAGIFASVTGGLALSYLFYRRYKS
jgi:hypothetical protein